MRTEPRLIGVLVALREEARAVEPGLRGRPAAIGRTGIGKRNAREKAAAFIAARRPRLIIATGFAAGLREDLRAGDILVAAEVIDRAGAGGPWRPSAAALQAALAAGEGPSGSAARPGRLVTVEKVLSSAAEKLEAAGATGADAADMESSGVLEAAGEAGVPVLCVRAILDEVGFELPFDFGRILTPGGRPRLLETIAAVGRNPAGLAKLLPLRARAQAAARSLALFIPRLVEALA